LIASTAHPGSFTVLFLLDASTFLVFVAVLSSVRESRPVEPEEADESALGYKAVLRDRNFVWLLGLNVLFVAVGYEVFALLQPFAKNYAGVSEHWVGVMWLANTLRIVLIQLPVSKALEGRRRMRALALMSLLFAAAALAPDHLRGRYFALGSMSWSTGSILGPAVGGPLLGWHPLAVWPLAAAISVSAAAGCLTLERRLPERVRRSPRAELLPETEQLAKPAPGYT
jgi:predicted MFS family arabinose efflux permease